MKHKILQLRSIEICGASNEYYNIYVFIEIYKKYFVDTPYIWSYE